MSSPPLTATSYAVLGLLAVKPWSSYELTQQMDRSLGRVWPRAVSKLYEEPKKLASHGLARPATQQNGRQRADRLHHHGPGAAGPRRVAPPSPATARCWSSSSC